MQPTPGAVRVALFSLVLIALHPPAASGRETLRMMPESAPVTLPANAKSSHDRLTLTEQTIGGKRFHVGTLAVNAPKDQVWSLLTDYSAAASHFSYLKKSSRLKRQGDTDLVQFTAKTGIGPLTVEYVLAIKQHESKGLIEWKRHSGVFKENEGYWKLEPIDDGKRTLITYAKYVDGGFPLPQSVASKAVKESMPVIFNDLNRSLDRLARRDVSHTAVKGTPN